MQKQWNTYISDNQWGEKKVLIDMAFDVSASNSSCDGTIF